MRSLVISLAALVAVASFGGAGMSQAGAADRSPYQPAYIPYAPGPAITAHVSHATETYHAGDTMFEAVVVTDADIFTDPNTGKHLQLDAGLDVGVTHAEASAVGQTTPTATVTAGGPSLGSTNPVTLTYLNRVVALGAYPTYVQDFYLCRDISSGPAAPERDPGVVAASATFDILAPAPAATGGSSSDAAGGR